MTTAPPPDPDRLLALLPQVVRDSDAFAGRPLQALLRVMAEQYDVVETDVRGLLANWFVETCDDWVLPYLGELVGYRPVAAAGVAAAAAPDDTPRGRDLARALFPRREFARTVAHRRRKGGLLLLQDVARDATGWPARAVEYRHLVRAAWAPAAGRGSVRGPALRDTDRFARGFGPFDDLPRRPDLRGLAGPNRRGSLGSVGLWVWRLKVHRIKKGEAKPVGDPDKARFRRFTLSPFGFDQELFVSPRPLPDPVSPAGEHEVPGPLRPDALRLDLASARPRMYGDNASLFLWRAPDPCPAHAGGAAAPTAIPADRVRVADLSGWDGPHWQALAERMWGVPDPRPPRNAPPDWKPELTVDAVVDPRTGRVVLRTEGKREALFARHHTARPADFGGGGYEREPLAGPPGAWLIRVSAEAVNPSAAALGAGVGAPAVDPRARVFTSLAAALHEWDGWPAPKRWVIEIDDDRVHPIGPDCGDPAVTTVGAGESLTVRAAVGRRPVVRHAWPAGTPAWLVGDTDVKGTGSGEFALDGVGLRVPLTATRLAHVRVRHATLADPDALVLGPVGCASVESSLVVGGVRAAPVSGPGVRLLLSDSVVAGAPPAKPRCKARHTTPTGWGDAIAGPVELTARRCTVFGAVRVSVIELAEDGVFAGALEATNVGRGCVRYSSLADPPADFPTTPPRYACQPDLAVAAGRPASAVAPRFGSTHPGDPDFARLSDACPPEVRRGGTAGAEMGAFHDLYTPYREALLAARLAEYTPAGADVRLLFAT